MNWFQVTLTLRGPSGTPWQADTIFGHLCWALKHREGDAALQEFLEPFLGGKPPLLLSSGFPPGHLPRPLSPYDEPDKTPGTLQRLRQLRKQDFVTIEDFKRCLQEPTFLPSKIDERHMPKDRVTPKNQVSRLTGTTGDEGNLFGFVEHWQRKVVIYLKVMDDYYQMQAEELFKHLVQSGYGKRKSVGYGAISDMKFESFEGFGDVKNANGFVTLSPFVPGASDPVDGFWRTRVKYGKLGEELAASANPFKRPVLMLTEGSTFRDPAPREWYGRMVTGVSDALPEVVHCGYALAVPMRLKERTDE